MTPAFGLQIASSPIPTIGESMTYRSLRFVIPNRGILLLRFDPEEPPGDASDTDYYNDETD